jgi:peptidoglycan/LPS O-acetylase OafA/YrhL
MLGSLIAYLGIVRASADSGMLQRLERIVQRSGMHNVLSFAGLGLLAASVLLLNSRQAFPGWWTLGPSLSATLIIAGPEAWPNRRLLSLRACVFFGLISYPLYL